MTSERRFVWTSATPTAPLCPVWWSRDAAQFSAHGETECLEGMASPAALALGEQQFWWTPRDGSEAAVKLHRARQFTCYADIPGVGGGRDIPTPATTT
ncbi:MAG: hypothetical protein CM15mP103_04110 [Gammaproteobacteria bacterium]|nr:MAG: hypothetical protein CM15mP103_04110 [Gammaproteobacteria bacterium]